MTNTFQSDYLNLLYTQVSDEIHFLETHHHDYLPISKPCKFCIRLRYDTYTCTRLKTLRSFKKDIKENISEHLRGGEFHPIPERRQIGVPLSANTSINYSEFEFKTISSSDPYANCIDL